MKYRKWNKYKMNITYKTKIWHKHIIIKVKELIYKIQRLSNWIKNKIQNYFICKRDI